MLSADQDCPMTVERSSPLRQKRRLVSDSGEEGSFLLHTDTLTPHDPGGGGGSGRKGKSQPCSPRMRHVSPRSRSRSESVPAMGVTSKVATASPELQRKLNGHRSRRDTHKILHNVHPTKANGLPKVAPPRRVPQVTKEDLALEAVMMESSKHLESVTRIVQQSFTQNAPSSVAPSSSSQSPPFHTPPSSQPVTTPTSTVHHYHNVNQQHYHQTHHYHYYYHPTYHSNQNKQIPALPHRYTSNAHAQPSSVQPPSGTYLRHARGKYTGQLTCTASEQDRNSQNTPRVAMATGNEKHLHKNGPRTHALNMVPYRRTAARQTGGAPYEQPSHVPHEQPPSPARCVCPPNEVPTQPHNALPGAAPLQCLTKPSTGKSTVQTFSKHPYSGATLPLTKSTRKGLGAPYGYHVDDLVAKPRVLIQMMKDIDDTFKHINRKDHSHVISRHHPSSRYRSPGPRSNKQPRPRMSSDTISLDDMSSDTHTSRTTSTMDCGSLDTILRQLEQERLRMERQRNRLCQASGLPPYDRHHTSVVPLAEPEQFADDGSLLMCGAGGPEDSDHISSIECLSVEEDVFMCSPDVSSDDTSRNETPRVTLRLDLITDVNGNGTARSRGLLNRRCDQLETSDEDDSASEPEDMTSQQDYDMAAFAEKYFNVHTSQTSGYGNAFTNIVRRRSLSEIIPMQDLLRYTKNSTIPTSHVILHSPEMNTNACQMFKDLCRIMRADVKSDAANQVIRSFVTLCQRHVELRDEAYCILMRQTNCNPNRDSSLRAWTLMCLCCLSFRCSKTLKKYLLCYLRKCCDDSDAKIARYATWCRQHCCKPRLTPRRMPPSAMEIECIRSSLPMVTRVHFLDGTTKAVGSDINATADDILKILRDKTGLASIHGWALYENSPDNDRFIRGYEYLADIISDWEDNQRACYSTGTPRRCSPRARKLPSPQNYGKILFCRRVFNPLTQISEDTVQYHLLYSQAVHNVVQVDEFSVSEGMALHLAGVQAQVIHGDYHEDKRKRYADVDQYICQRILLDNDPKDWIDDIEDAHERYGDNKSMLEAELYYLSIVTSFPFYGAMKFFAHYQGLWLYGIEFIIAISFSDIKFISVQDKMVLYDYLYTDIEFIRLDFENNSLTLQLKTSVQGRQKSYMFECLDLEDIATILEVYAPQHVTWVPLKNGPYKRKWQVSDKDCLGQYDAVINCRKELVESNLILKPAEQPSGFIKSTIKKIQGRPTAPETLPCIEDLHLRGGFWSFTRLPFTQPLMAFGNEELADVAVRLFNSTLIYTGIETTDIEGLDIIEVLQTVITKCMESADLCNEFYLQVTKQTTDVQKQDFNTGGMAYWHLLLMVACILLPGHPMILNYVIVHLKRHALCQHTEHGRFAQFAIQCLHRTYESKGRLFPPSCQEIEAVTNRQHIELLVSLPDGHQIFVEFHSASTVQEIMDQIKMKIGARMDGEGFAIYRLYDEKEKEEYLLPEDKMADYLFKTEKWLKKNNLSTQDIRYIFKKRIFVEPYMNLCDPVEVDLLYHQSVTDVFEGRIPLTKTDTIQICALRAQTEYGNYGIANNFDYSSVMRILPRHLRELIHIPDISLVHKTHHGVSPMAANIKFLDVVRHWPLYGATFFEITQTHLDEFPFALWLAVSQLGIHMMEQKGQTIYTTYTYKDIECCQPSLKNLTILLKNVKKPEDIVVNTTQSQEIVQLITDYQKVLASRSPISEHTPAYEYVDDCELQSFDRAEETRL